MEDLKVIATATGTKEALDVWMGHHDKTAKALDLAFRKEWENAARKAIEKLFAMSDVEFKEHLIEIGETKQPC